MMRRALLLAAAAAAAIAGHPCRGLAQDVRTVTLDQAIDLARQNQPAQVLARQNVRVAEAQERQASAAFLPNVSGTIATSTTGGNRINQFGATASVASFYSSTIGLTASWDVFTGFRRGAARSAAQAASAQREELLRSQDYNTVLATKQAFFVTLADAELVTVAQTRLRSADQQLKLTSEKLRLGATTRSDSLRAQVAYGTAQVALITAQNNLRIAQANLGRQIQVDGLVMGVADSTLFVRGQLDTAALMREALAEAPTVRAADAAVANARATVSVNRAAYLPTATISGGNTWAAGVTPTLDSTGHPVPGTGTTSPFSGAYASGWNLRFQITYPLFNNLTRETNYLVADAGLQSAIASARDTRLALSASLTQWLSVMQSAAARIDVGTLNVAAAEEDLRMQTERYRLGAVTIIETLTSQANLDQARTDLVQARYDYVTAKAQIEALVGHGL